MAKIPDKFEDWTPPWKPEEFDSDRAAKLVYNALKEQERLKSRNATLGEEKTELQDKVDDFEAKAAKGGKGASDDEKDTQIAELQKQVRDLTRNGRPEDKSLIERLEVAIEHGLTANDAKRLVGNTRDELDADAKDLAERFGISRDGDEGGSGSEGDLGGGAPRGGVEPVVRRTNGGGNPPPKVLSVEELLKLDSPGGRQLIPQR